MNASESLDARQRMVGRGARGALFALLLSGIGLALAASVPIDALAESAEDPTVQAKRFATESDTTDLGPLLVRLAGSELIRPARLQAAVKDDGTAMRLAKQLKLQGIIQTGDTHVAYIQVEKQKLEVVRDGDAILEFIVEKVEPHRVTLTLRGVTVTLSF